MMKLTVIAPSKLKEKYLKDAQDEYIKRLSRYCNVNLIEPEPIRLSDNPSASEITSALEKESDIILKKIPENAYIIAMCIEGKEISSEKFAEKISELSDMGRGICIIIGSSYGLSEKVKNTADFKLSVSKMTFPHQLFRIMLLEQVYRGFKIREGSKYHK